MLDFIFLLEILLIFAAVYGIIILAKFIKGRTDIHVKYGSTDILSELGDLRKDNSEGATGYEVRLTADSTKTIGKVVVKDEVGWVYLPKTDEAYSNDKTATLIRMDISISAEKVRKQSVSVIWRSLPSRMFRPS